MSEREDSLLSLQTHYRNTDYYTNARYHDFLLAYSIDQRTPDYYFELPYDNTYIIRQNNINRYTRFIVRIDTGGSKTDDKIDEVVYLVDMNNGSVMNLEVLSYRRNFRPVSRDTVYFIKYNTMVIDDTYNVDDLNLDSYHHYTLLSVIVSKFMGFSVLPRSMREHNIRVRIYIVYTDENIRKDMFILDNVLGSFFEDIERADKREERLDFITEEFKNFFVNKLHVFTARSVILLPITTDYIPPPGNAIPKFIYPPHYEDTMYINNVILFRYKEDIFDINMDLDFGYVYKHSDVTQDNLTMRMNRTGILSEDINDMFIVPSFYRKVYSSNTVLTIKSFVHYNCPSFIFYKRDATLEDKVHSRFYSLPPSFKIETYGGFYMFSIVMDYFRLSIIKEEKYANIFSPLIIIPSKEITDLHFLSEANDHYPYVIRDPVTLSFSLSILSGGITGGGGGIKGGDGGIKGGGGGSGSGSGLGK